MARKKVERNISYDEIRKRYYVHMDYGLDRQGKRVRKYSTYPTLTAARAGLKEFLVLQHQNQLPVANTQTLEEWLEYWLEDIVRPTRAETTTYAYEKIIQNHIVPHLGHLLLSQVTPLLIQQYYLTMSKEYGLSANTIRRHHALLSTAFRSAVWQECLTKSPIERVEPPRPQIKESPFYNCIDLKRLYTLIDGHDLELPVKLAAGMGLRREEVCGLKWDCVDFDRHVIHIRAARTTYGANVIQKETKNRSSIRTLYVPDELYELLWMEYNYQEKQKVLKGNGFASSGHVLLGSDGKPRSPNALSISFYRFI